LLLILILYFSLRKSKQRQLALLPFARLAELITLVEDHDAILKRKPLFRHPTICQNPSKRSKVTQVDENPTKKPFRFRKNVLFRAVNGIEEAEKVYIK